MMLMNYNYVFLIMAILLCGCKKDNIVPNIRFEVTINLSDPQYAKKDVLILLDVEDYVSKIRTRVGYSGVLVYRSDNYRAFERYCPHDKNDDCKVSLKENTTTAVCNCCKTEYLLLTGAVVQGKSKYGLKEYKTEYIYDRNLLRIWN
jgi:nitrite reductase/ring-hydroxylating ferredoxin subunit